VGEKTFFTVLVESAGPEESFIQVFWAWAGHLGAAIERVLRAWMVYSELIGGGLVKHIFILRYKKRPTWNQ
jgi:hypothetical protein